MRIFHRVRLPLVVAAVSATGLVGWQAIADHGPGHDEHGEKGHHERHAGEHRDGGMAHGRHEGHHMWSHDGGADDEGEDDTDAGTVHVTRTPEQEARHARMVSHERDKLRDWTRTRKRHLTLVERQAMGTHWRHVIRLQRIREIAEQEKDTATVKKVDELLERENKKFDERLGKFATEEASPKSGSSTSDGGAR